MIRGTGRKSAVRVTSKKKMVMRNGLPGGTATPRRRNSKRRKRNASQEVRLCVLLNSRGYARLFVRVLHL